MPLVLENLVKLLLQSVIPSPCVLAWLRARGRLALHTLVIFTGPDQKESVGIDVKLDLLELGMPRKFHRLYSTICVASSSHREPFQILPLCPSPRIVT